MRRWRATTAGAIVAAAALVLVTVAVVRSASSGPDTALRHTPNELRLIPGDPASRGGAGARGGGVDGGAAVDPAAPSAAASEGGVADGVNSAGDAVIAPPPDQFEAPAAPPAPPPAALRTLSSGPRSGGVWAVMVGINDYPGTRSDLRSAVNDANDMNEALARFGVPGDHRLLIRDRQATAGVVLAAADWLVDRAGPDATAVFFYAGHVRKLSPSTEAIVGADGRVVTDALLADHLRPLQAGKVWLVMASCYGGGFDEMLGPGRVLTAAADANHLAYENEAYGRSYLVQFMVREAMIEGRAPQSVQAAYGYAQGAISRSYPGRAPVEYDQVGVPVDLRQPAAVAGGTPTGSGSGSGSGAPASGGSSPPTSAPPSNDSRCTHLGVLSVNCS